MGCLLMTIVFQWSCFPSCHWKFCKCFSNYPIIQLSNVHYGGWGVLIFLPPKPRVFFPSDELFSTSFQSMNFLPVAWLQAHQGKEKLILIIDQCFVRCTFDNSPLILETSQLLCKNSLSRENVNCGPRNDCWSSSVASKMTLPVVWRGWHRNKPASSLASRGGLSFTSERVRWKLAMELRWEPPKEVRDWNMVSGLSFSS